MADEIAVKPNKNKYSRKRVSPWFSTLRWKPENSSLCMVRLEFQYADDPRIYAGSFNGDTYLTTIGFGQNEEDDIRRTPDVVTFRYSPRHHYLGLSRS